MTLRRPVWAMLALLLLLGVVGTAIGVTSYHAGVTHGLASHENATVVVRDGGEFGFGFFPFFLIFPLGFFLFFAVLRGGFRGGRRGMNSGGRGPGGGGEGGPMAARMEEWHRRAHERIETPATDTTPATDQESPK